MNQSVDSLIKSELITFVDLLRLGVFPEVRRNAKNGAWIPAKGTELFDALRAHFGDELPFFAEDLGIITEDVEALRIENNLMGMKILQFAFTEDDHIYMPHMYDSENWVCYTGTHDNNTTIGWFDEAPDYERNRFLEYTQSDGSQANWAMLSLALSSKATLGHHSYARFYRLGCIRTDEYLV